MDKDKTDTAVAVGVQEAKAPASVGEKQDSSTGNAPVASNFASTSFSRNNQGSTRISLRNLNRVLSLVLVLLFITMAWVIASPPLRLPGEPGLVIAKANILQSSGLGRKDIYVSAFQSRDLFSADGIPVGPGETNVTLIVDPSAVEQYISNNMRLEGVAIYDDVSKSRAVVHDTSTGSLQYVVKGGVLKAGSAELTLEELHRTKIVLTHGGAGGGKRITLDRR